MILNADDLGCAADGRWLREVSIPAGSPVMTVPAGTVLGVGVGGIDLDPGRRGYGRHDPRAAGYQEGGEHSDCQGLAQPHCQPDTVGGAIRLARSRRVAHRPERPPAGDDARPRLSAQQSLRR